MITYEEFVKALDTVQKYRDQINNEIHTVSHLVNETKLYEVGFTTRLMNALMFAYTELFPHRKRFKDVLVSDLEGINIRTLHNISNIGPKAIIELKNVCEAYNIKYIG